MIYFLYDVGILYGYDDHNFNNIKLMGIDTLQILNRIKIPKIFKWPSQPMDYLGKTQPPTSSHLMQSNQKRSTVLLIDSDGFSNYTCYLARGLSKYRNVILYSFSVEAFNITGADKEKGIEFHYVKRKLPKGYSTVKGILRVIILYFILFSALMRTNYEIVHVQEHLPTFFLFIPLLKLRRKQICWTLHDVEIFKPALGLNGELQLLFLKIVSMPALMIRYSDKIIVHATSLKKQLILRNVDKNKISVIRHFDYQYLIEHADNEDKSVKSIGTGLGHDYGLFLGNIAPWKGIDTLIDAGKIVKDKLGEKFNLLIAGKPYEGFKEIPFFSNVNKDPHKFIIIIEKYITSSEIPVLMSRSAFVIVPYNSSFQHSASGIIPLAYTFSKPVIVSNIPSLAEYVEHGKTGLVFDIDDSKQLANCMIELIEDNSRCVEMGKMGRQKLMKEMSLEICSKMINMLYP